jgi:aminoglycoside phosphotransferase (APT) family kinase protein
MNHRSAIYYWKCDRPAAFHGTDEAVNRQAYEDDLRIVMQQCFPGRSFHLRPAAGQGNHITWLAAIDGADYFIRIEDGPEKDDYLEIESRLLIEMAALAVPAPKVYGVDAGRRLVPFAWQVLEFIPYPDLNQLLKQGRLDVENVAERIGAAVARWQKLPVSGFGPFDSDLLRRESRLQGFHSRYEDYFFLHLDRHLKYLVHGHFLTVQEAEEMKDEIQRYRDLLVLAQGCLVHKDLALWNILGSEKEILAFIDWDDAIGGDPMDDLSLLGCFYDGAVLERALQGYAAVRPLPSEYRKRFWLHLLRNMIVKSVIRLAAGYFNRTDRFFLINAGGNGADLRAFTRQRLAAAVVGLRENQAIENL